MKFKTLNSKFNLIMVGIAICFSIFAAYDIEFINGINRDYFKMINNTKILLEDSTELTKTYGELRRNVTRVAYERNTDSALISTLEGYCAYGQQVSAKFLENLKDVHEQGYDMSELIDMVQDIQALQLDYHNNFQLLKGAIESANNTLNDSIDSIRNTEENEADIEDAEAVINAIINNTNDALVAQYISIVAAIGEELNVEISDVSIATFDTITLEVDRIQEEKARVMVKISLLFLLCASVSSILLRGVASRVTKPIRKIKDASTQIASGNLNVDIKLDLEDEIGDLSEAVDTMVVNFKGIITDINKMADDLDEGRMKTYKINSSKYQGAYKDVVEAVNRSVDGLVEENLYMINLVKSLGVGNFDIEVRQLPGDKVALTESVVEVQEILNGFVESINKLSKDVGNGEFKNLLVPSDYEGEWVGIAEGLNTLVQIIDEAMFDTKTSLVAFAKGNFDYRITKDYKGSFSEVVDATNYTAETVGSYIAEISRILNEMSNQNFDVEMTLNYVGDFKRIQNSVENININLNSLVKNIIASAEQVADGSNQISDSSVALAEGATEQAQSVEKLTAITELISKQSEESVNNSIKANNLVSETKDSANESNDKMNALLVSMDKINESSHSISNIIRVIEDIAFQTNILALNAAVEAARAGEYGKGFAVVAEEVRSLANRSQQAAKQTTSLIETATQNVDQGSSIANSTSEALTAMLTQIEDISVIIRANKESTIEQQNSILEITNNINEISKVTQINTSTSEETASASEELSNQAELFYNSVSGIKIKE